MIRRVVVVATLSFAATGCFQVTTTDVQVRDGRAVALVKNSGETVLAPSSAPTATEATVERGAYPYLFSRQPFDLRASRDSRGAIDLRCDTCADAPYPFAGTDHVELLDATGRTAPTLAWLVDQGTSSTRVTFDVCMVSGRFCRVSAKLNLVIPAGDVVEVRRRTEPIRVWGYMLLAFSVVAAGVGVYALASPATGATLGDRAPWAAAFFIPAFTLGGIGAWTAFAPVQEQVWRP